MTPLEDDLRRYFERYARTFHDDLGAFCDLYHFPSMTVRLDGAVQLFQNRDEALRFFSAAKQRYEREGCRHWAIRGLTVQELGTGGAAATIDWEMTDAGHAPIRGWRQTYEVVGGPGRWRVLCSTLHAGSERAYGRDA